MNDQPHTVTLIAATASVPRSRMPSSPCSTRARAPIAWEEVVVGRDAEKPRAIPCRRGALETVRRNRIALKGPVGTPVGKGFASVNVRLRRRSTSTRTCGRCATCRAIESRYSNVDMVIVRENTESLYSGLEHTVVPGVVESLKIITAAASTRIARYAFDYARLRGRKRVTAVHKANIMKLSDGLFLECFRRVAEEYPDIAADDRIVDAACMQLVMAPEAFDVLLTENLYGDIVSDLAAGLVGGLGVVPGANIGAEGAVFEAVHGSAPDIAGKDLANPTRAADVRDPHAAAPGLAPIADRVGGACSRRCAPGSRRRTSGARRERRSSPRPWRKESGG
jgi:isocitrate dehydrogenase (NAD+)